MDLFRDIDLETGSNFVAHDTFGDFARRYREMVLRPENVNQAKQMIRKFVRRIEVSPTSVVIHFIVDADHYRTVESENNGANGGPCGPKKIGSLEASRVKKSAYFSSNTLTVGAQAEQVGEHPGSVTTFVFEMEAYPEAKSLIGTEIEALYRKFKSWPQVAKAVGSSESFVRQNSVRKK